MLLQVCVVMLSFEQDGSIELNCGSELAVTEYTQNLGEIVDLKWRTLADLFDQQPHICYKQKSELCPSP